MTDHPRPSPDSLDDIQVCHERGHFASGFVVMTPDIVADLLAEVRALRRERDETKAVLAKVRKRRDRALERCESMEMERDSARARAELARREMTDARKRADLLDSALAGARERAARAERERDEAREEVVRLRLEKMPAHEGGSECWQWSGARRGEGVRVLTDTACGDCRAAFGQGSDDS